ncbi:MAG: molybdopterin-dependent oxidoreductase [Defluviitaleaceae bacterium]|nr:molybdopterin-dependent oxidoreductase [Defluviitaleaceae bacterium]
MSNSIAELEDADVIFQIGGNAHHAHPVIGTFKTGAKKKGTKFIMADPRVVGTAHFADIFMQQKAGTDIPLVNAMINHIISNDLHNKAYIEERTQDFDAMWDIIKDCTPEVAAEITGVSADKIKEAAELYAKGPNSAITWGMGVAQRHNAVELVWTLANLALVCGHIGRRSTGLNPLRGQNNVQGGCDQACLPHFLPGYQIFDEDFIRALGGGDAGAAAARAVGDKFEELWGVKLNRKHGLTQLEMCDAALEGKVKAMYVMGADPVTMNPDANQVIKALEALDFLVVQDPNFTMTAQMADVYLPAASVLETYGTVVNTERRVQMTRPVVQPVGEARADFEIMIDLMNRFGYTQNQLQADNYSTAKHVMDEMNKALPQYAGVTFDKIQRRNNRYDGVRWPIAADAEEGVRYLFTSGFPAGKVSLKGSDYTKNSKIAEPPCDEYPMVLITIRDLYHYDNFEMTGKSKFLLELDPHGVFEINTATADKYGVKAGDEVKLVSRRGEAKAIVKINDGIADGDVFSNFHHPDTHINKVTIAARDPWAHEPELKACAVKMVKV